jgi:hypothetical protein
MGYGYPGYAQQGAGGGGYGWNQAGYGQQPQAGGGYGMYQQGGYQQGGYQQPQQGGFGGYGQDVSGGYGGATSYGSGYAAQPQMGHPGMAAAAGGAPAGVWSEEWDHTSSRFYYHNSATGLSQWEKPAEMM